MRFIIRYANRYLGDCDTINIMRREYEDIEFFKHWRSTAAAAADAPDNTLSQTLVSEIYKIHGTSSIILPEDLPLDNIITRFTGEPSLRGMFLKDAQGRFSGMVTRNDLLRWVRLKLFGGKGSHETSIAEFYRIMDARKGKDIANGALNRLIIRETDSLQSALDKMLDNEMEILPVLNSQNEIVGDLRLSEILSWILANRDHKLTG